MQGCGEVRCGKAAERRVSGRPERRISGCERACRIGVIDAEIFGGRFVEFEHGALEHDAGNRNVDGGDKGLVLSDLLGRSVQNNCVEAPVVADVVVHALAERRWLRRERRRERRARLRRDPVRGRRKAEDRPLGLEDVAGDGLTLNQQVHDLADVGVLQLDDFKVLRAVAARQRAIRSRGNRWAGRGRHVDQDGRAVGRRGNRELARQVQRYREAGPGARKRDRRDAARAGVCELIEGWGLGRSRKDHRRRLSARAGDRPTARYALNEGQRDANGTRASRHHGDAAELSGTVWSRTGRQTRQNDGGGKTNRSADSREEP